jgi:hypothetical protein
VAQRDALSLAQGRCARAARAGTPAHALGNAEVASSAAAKTAKRKY